MIQLHFCSKGAGDFFPYPVQGRKAEFSILKHMVQHLSIKPLWVKHWKCQQQWSLMPRKLQNSYITFLIKGRGEIKQGGLVYQVSPGDMIFFPEGVMHSFSHPDGEYLEMINIHFYAKVYGLMDFLSLQGLQGVFHDQTDFSGAIAFELAKISALNPPCGSELMVQLIKSVLIYSLYHFPEKSSLVTGDFKNLMKVYPALELIRNRLSDPALKQADLAKKIAVSEVYLRKLFNKLFNESPVKFINCRRIERACTLLLESNNPVKWVAEESGFRDLQFFYRIFKRITGLTPAAYRNKIDL